jgi:YidC/Oxa1 family membrane protein insertase
MILLQLFAQQQITKRNPQAAAANPQMQMINKVFPFLFGIWGWAFQAGLTLYWAVSAALRIVQQTALYRFDPKLAESVRERKAEFERDVRTAVEKKGSGSGKKVSGGPTKPGGQTKPKTVKDKPQSPGDRVLKPATQPASGGTPKPNPGRQQPKKRRKGR